MEISVFDTYEVHDLTSDVGTKAFIERLKKELAIDKEENEIELNLDGCVTNYGAISPLIDYLLNILAEHKGDKKLIVQMSGPTSTDIIYSKLFGDSSLFDTKGRINGANATIQEWTQKVSKYLKPKNITIHVRHIKLTQQFIFPKP